MGFPAGLGIEASGAPPLNDQANAVISGVISGVGPQKPFAFRGPMNLLLWASYSTALTTTAGSLSASVAAAGVLAVGTSINSQLVFPGTTIKTIAGTAITMALPPITIWGTLQSNGLLTVLPPNLGVPDISSLLIGAGITVQANSFGVTLPAGTLIQSVVQPSTANSQFAAGVPAIYQLSNVPGPLPSAPQLVPFELIFAPAGIYLSGTDALASFTGNTIVYNGSVQVERSFDGGFTWILGNIGGIGQAAIYNGGGPISLTFGEPEKLVLYRFNCTAYTPIAGTTLNYRISQTGGAAESLAIGPLTGG